MSKVFFVILLAVTLLIAFEACTKSCNNNGFCYVDENNTEKCECLDRIYVGESCEMLVDYCDENPCKNGGKCISTPGQYNCLCTENTYGQNCTLFSQNKFFGQIFLQYNHVAPISDYNNLLLILTDLGSVRSVVELSSSDYAIVGNLFFPSKDFLKTDNIQAIAKMYKIQGDSLPSGNVYYHVAKYRMARNGVKLVTLTISDANNFTLYYSWSFQFGSIKNVGCNPLISIINCGTPRAPANINANQPVFVEANVQRDCGHDSRMTYKWSICNYFDTRTLQPLNATSRSFKIPAFGIDFNYSAEDIFWNLNIIKLISLEESADGNRLGEVVNRCYIDIFLDKLISKISGGDFQEYSYKQPIKMDGSQSVDLSLHPKKNPNLSYSWRCSSVDANEFCRTLNETGALQPLLVYLF